MKEFFKENFIIVYLITFLLGVLISGTIIELNKAESVNELVTKNGLSPKEARCAVYGEDCGKN